jgi:hypothetical protein
MPKAAKPDKPPRKDKPQQPYAELPEALDIRKVGRPSHYDPSYCELIRELGAQGKSKAQMASAIGVVRNTLDSWAKKYPEFAQAMQAAQELSLAWWETTGQQNMIRSGFNATAYIFQMKNRFREDYRDTVNQEVTGKDGKDLMPEASDRDLARAVLDILRTAPVEKSDASR